MKDHKNRFRGTLLGLAIGDALGTTVEFSYRGQFTPMTDIVGGGPFQLDPGQWTDDTSMALCLGESLVTHHSMNLEDQLERYLSWWRSGHNSVTGVCFDIGNTVRLALENYWNTHEAYSGSNHPASAGNGSIMRLTPVPMFFANNKEQAIQQAGESSKTTHGAPECIDSCRVMSSIITSFLNGSSIDEALNSSTLIASCLAITPRLKEVLLGSYKTKPMEDIKGSGYVIESLEAALWAFYHSETFEQGALMAVNLGDDADTTGAVYGQIAGAYYGKSGIPKHWLRKLAWQKRIETLADKLYKNTL